MFEILPLILVGGVVAAIGVGVYEEFNVGNAAANSFGDAENTVAGCVSTGAMWIGIAAGAALLLYVAKKQKII
jgi:hypothetical protein